MVDRTIIAAVQDYLMAVGESGVPVDYGIVFGSFARSDSKEWSDIDLLVVSSRFDEERSFEDVFLLWETAALTDSRIEPIPVGSRQIEEDDSSAIIEIARREGRRVDVLAKSAVLVGA